MAAIFSALPRDVQLLSKSCPDVIPRGQAILTLQLYGNIAEMAAHVQSVDTKPFLFYHAALTSVVITQPECFNV